MNERLENTQFVKYKKIPFLDNIPEILDNEVYVFEKLDGGNCQFRKIDGRIRCGNRANFIEGRSFNRSWFPQFRKYLTANYSLYEVPENLIFYGEWLSKQEIQYDEENMNKFYLINIFDINVGKFIDYKNAVNIVRELGLKGINLLKILREGKINRVELEELTEKSDFYDGLREGLVIKDYKRQLFAKIHSPFYQEILFDRKLPPEERFVTKRAVTKAISWLNEDKGQFSHTDLIEYLRKNINEEHGLLLDIRKIDNMVKKVISKKNKQSAWIERAY